MFETYKTPTVRDAFGQNLCELATSDERVILVSGDSQGASKTTVFTEKYPDRSYNLGIAEQNMVAFSAGMALEGYIPFVSTRAPFLSMRSAEQIRVAVCYDDLPVRFVGTGAGYCSGTAGATHWALEDVAILSSFANMTVFETGDVQMLKSILMASTCWHHPMYIRLGRDTEEQIYDEELTISLGGSVMLKKGTDGYFLAAGTTVNFALRAAYKLSEKGLDIGVIDMFSLKPIDREAIATAARTGHVVAVHDHNLIGGLGSLVGAVLLDTGLTCSFKSVGCPDYFEPPASADYLYHKHGMDAEGLAESMLAIIKG